MTAQPFIRLNTCNEYLVEEMRWRLADSCENANKRRAVREFSDRSLS